MTERVVNLSRQAVALARFGHAFALSGIGFQLLVHDGKPVVCLLQFTVEAFDCRVFLGPLTDQHHHVHHKQDKVQRAQQIHRALQKLPRVRFKIQQIFRKRHRVQRSLQGTQTGQQEQRRHHAEEPAARSAVQAVYQIHDYIQQQTVVVQMQRKNHAQREQRLGPADEIMAAPAQYAHANERRHSENRHHQRPRLGGQRA